MPERPIREEVDALIVRTREAHEVLRDIKTATKELKDTIKLSEETRESLAGMLAKVVNDGISVAVEVGLDNYSVAIDEAIQHAERGIYQRFDAIAAIMLGEAGDLEDAARLVRRSTEAGHTMTPHEQWQMDEMQKALDRRLNEEIRRSNQ